MDKKNRDLIERMVNSMDMDEVQKAKFLNDTIKKGGYQITTTDPDPHKPFTPIGWIDKYQEWIDSYSGDILRNCTKATMEMKEAFPELTRVRGHVQLVGVIDLRPHWWLTKDKIIIDPTVAQWQLRPIRYIPWDENKQEPTGKCPNCGAYCFDHKCFCCKDCEIEYTAYLNER